MLPVPGRIRVLGSGLLIGTDVEVAEDDLTPTHDGVGVREVGAALSERLHLGTAQRDTRVFVDEANRQRD